VFANNIVAVNEQDLQNLCNLYYSNSQLFYSKLNSGEFSLDDCSFISFISSKKTEEEEMIPSKRDLKTFGMTIVITVKAYVAQHPEFPTYQSLREYVNHLLDDVVSDGSFDNNLLVLAEREGFDKSTISMLQYAKTYKVEYSQVIVSEENSTTEHTSKPLQIGVAIGAFFFFLLVLTIGYYFFAKTKDQTSNVQDSGNQV
jgi:hypothetical protein